MSVINRMLQDLDARRANHETISLDGNLALAAAPPSPPPAPRLIGVRTYASVSALLAAFAVGAYWPSTSALPATESVAGAAHESGGAMHPEAVDPADQEPVVHPRSAATRSPTAATRSPTAAIAIAPAATTIAPAKQRAAREPDRHVAQASTSAGDENASSVRATGSTRGATSAPSERSKPTGTSKQAGAHAAPAGAPASSKESEPRAHAGVGSADAQPNLQSKAQPEAATLALAAPSLPGASTGIGSTDGSFGGSASRPATSQDASGTQRDSSASTPKPAPRIERKNHDPAPAGHAEAAYREGLARYNAGDPSGAMKSMRAALAQNARYVPARQALAAMLIDRNQWAEARAVLADGLQLDPGQGQFALLSAQLSMRLGERDAALLTLEKASAAGHATAEVHATLAGLLAKMKRDREALPHWLAALRLSPQQPEWWLGLAIALEADARPAEARSAYGRALESGRLAPKAAEFVRDRLASLR